MRRNVDGGFEPVGELTRPGGGSRVRALGLQLVAELQVPGAGVKLALSALVKLVTDTLIFEFTQSECSEWCFSFQEMNFLKCWKK